MPELQEVLPKYLQIAGHIRDQIIRGDLVVGDEVPSERHLAATWNVARPTAARALEALRVQGFVESRQGSGTYVRDPHAAPRARERFDRARQLGTMYSPTESVEFLAIEVVKAPANVSAALRLPKGSKALRRARLLRGSGDKPIELSTSWFAPDMVDKAPRLLEPERLLGGTGKYIGEVASQVPAYGRDQVAARLATAEERELLQLDNPSAVLVYELTICDASDGPVQFDQATYPPERWAFHQEYPVQS